MSSNNHTTTAQTNISLNTKTDFAYQQQIVEANIFKEQLSATSSMAADISSIVFRLRRISNYTCTELQ